MSEPYDYEADDSHVYLLFDEKVVQGVYAHKSDAYADAELLSGRYRVERWAIDFSTVAVESA